jgi:hypothetical protein
MRRAPARAAQAAEILLMTRAEGEAASDFQEYTLIALVAVAAHLEGCAAEQVQLPALAARFGQEPGALEKARGPACAGRALAGGGACRRGGEGGQGEAGSSLSRLALMPDSHLMAAPRWPRASAWAQNFGGEREPLAARAVRSSSC